MPLGIFMQLLFINTSLNNDDGQIEKKNAVFQLIKYNHYVVFANDI